MNDNNVFSISERNGINAIRPTDEEILSIGISTGGVAEIEMLEGNPNRHVTATTIDEKGLESTRINISNQGLSNRIAAKYEDVTKPMDYPDKHFDFIYARLVLHYLDDYNLRKALHELRRVIKTDGKFFIVVKSNNNFHLKDEGTTFDEKTGITTYPDDRGTGVFHKRRFHTKDSITKFLNEAGFTVGNMYEYDEDLCYDYMRTEKVSQSEPVIEILADPQREKGTKSEELNREDER